MKKIHYAWVVCFVGTLLIFISMGTVSNGFSIYLPFIRDEVGLTNAETSSLVTIRCLTALFGMILVGPWYKKFSIRVGTCLACLSSAVAYVIFHYANNYLMFCVGAAVFGFAYGLSGMIPVSILMHRWFDSHLALAVGICGAGSGLATVILPPVTTALVESFGLKTTFLIESVFIVVCLAVVFLLLRDNPEDMGLKPLKKEGEVKKEVKVSLEDNPNLTKWMWFLFIFTGFTIGAPGNPGFVHLSVLFTSEGYDPMVVATLVSITGLMLAVGKIIYGQISDRIGGFKSSILFELLLITGCVLCCMSSLGSVALAYIAAFIYGTGTSITTVGPAVWAREIAPKKDYDSVVKWVQVAYAAGSFAFASTPGILADRFDGSYVPAYIMFGLISTLVLGLIIYMYMKRRSMAK